MEAVSALMLFCRNLAEGHVTKLLFHVNPSVVLDAPAQYSDSYRDRQDIMHAHTGNDAEKCETGNSPRRQANGSAH